MTRGDRDVGTRRTWRIAGIGTLVLGGGFAAATAIAGGSGREGLRWFVLGALLSCLAGAIHAVVTGAIDSLREREVGRGRVIAAVVLGSLSIVLVPMLVGLAA